MLKQEDIAKIRDVVREELFAHDLRERASLEFDDGMRDKIAQGLEELDLGECVSSEALEQAFGFHHTHPEA